MHTLELDKILAKLDPRLRLSHRDLVALGSRFDANIVQAEFSRPDGSRIYRRGQNARTNAGANYMALALFSSSSNAINYMALSSATLTPAAGDTTLTSEITTSGLARKQATFGSYTAPASLGANASCVMSASYTNGGGSAVAVTSVGLFSASSGGTLVFEVNLTAGNTVNPGDSVAINYSIQL